MKLLLDIGNSRIKWAWFDGVLQPGGAVSHRDHGPSAAFDSIALPRRPDQIWAASVAGGELQKTAEAWARAAGQPVHWARSEAAGHGVTNAYQLAEQLGVDRWLALIAGYRRAGGAALIIDAGTAITLDVVSAEGRHRGGLIAPGLTLQRLSLRQQTQLRPGEPGSLGWLAADTNAAIGWGSLHAVVGLIERVRTGIREDYGPMRQYVTGGEAGALLPCLQGEWVHAPDLVLEGLALQASS